MVLLRNIRHSSKPLLHSSVAGSKGDCLLVRPRRVKEVLKLIPIKMKSRQKL